MFIEIERLSGCFEYRRETARLVLFYWNHLNVQPLSKKSKKEENLDFISDEEWFCLEIGQGLVHHRVEQRLFVATFGLEENLVGGIHRRQIRHVAVHRCDCSGSRLKSTNWEKNYEKFELVFDRLIISISFRNWILKIFYQYGFKLNF